MKCCAVLSLLTLRTNAVCQPLWKKVRRVLLNRCVGLTLVNTRCPPGSSHSPPQQQVMCGPLPGSRAQHAELLPRAELLVPMPSCSHCREAPRQFTLQAVLGLLLQRVWSCCHCSWCSACAEPELPLRL